MGNTNKTNAQEDDNLEEVKEEPKTKKKGDPEGAKGGPS